MSVREVIERLRGQGNTAKAGYLDEYENPKPLRQNALGALRLPTGEALVHMEIPTAGDQEHLLKLEPGRESLRVLGCHKRIEFWWKYPSFAAYLAHHFGFEEPS